MYAFQWHAVPHLPDAVVAVAGDRLCGDVFHAG